MTRGRLRAAALSAVLICLAVPSAASAGTVGLNGGQVDFVAEDGQVNTITVTGGGGQITIRDAGHDVLLLPFTDADEKCTHPTSDSASCPATSVDVQAADLDDTIDASGANITSASSIGAVFLNGGDGGDRVTGGPSVDTIAGDTGNDTLAGGGGNDFITGGDGNDKLSGGDGNDQLEVVAFSTLGDDTIDGGSGDDTLVQPQRGPAGMSDGADTFNGGPGIDTANYGSSEGSVSLSLDGQPNDGYGSEGDNLGADVENLTSGPAADMIAGSDSPNTIDAGGGDDIVAGLGGPDELQGGTDAGSDTLDGGEGQDHLVAGPGDDQLEGAGGDDTLEGNGGTDTEVGGDGVDAMTGGPGGDELSGGPGDDLLRGADDSGAGGDATDKIHGGAGVDQINGEGGDDIVDGGTGADLLVGGEGRDVADYGRDQAPVAVTIDDKPNDGPRNEHDNVMSDIEDVNGGDFDSSVVGTPGTNALTGGAGEDYSDGAGGADTLTSGAAGDTVRSRDGVADAVDCGAGPDFVIADPGDRVNKKTCEEVDVGKSKPIYGKKVVAKPSGDNLLKRPGIQRFVPLSDPVGLRFGSTLSPVAGAKMTLVSATRSGARQTGTFRGDAFLVKQSRGSGITELTLVGGLSLSKCGRAKAGAAASHKVTRRLFGRAHGRFRTHGRYSSATVRGTEWSVEDRCDGTLTRVQHGTVTVRDFGRRRTIKVPAGKSYLARRGNR